MIAIRVKKRFWLDPWVVRVSASRPSASSASFSLRGGEGVGMSWRTPILPPGPNYKGPDGGF